MKFRFKRLSDLDRLLLAEAQLEIVHEQTGYINRGHVCRAAGSWCESDRQYDMLKANLIDYVTT